MKISNLPLLAILASLIWPELAHGTEIDFQVVSWNVESGDARTSHIAREITEDFDGVELWGLSEVQNDDVASQFEAAAENGEGTELARIVGTSGGNDRLVILYDSNRFELLESFELEDINVSGTVRAPLVAKLKESTSSKVFLFMVNHLYRGSSVGRHEQARLLNEWAAGQSEIVIAVGDYNFDWHYQSGDTDHDEGYDFMTAGGTWEWVRPETLAPTNASGHESVLDFIFWSTPGATRTGWNASSEIYVRTNDFPDDHLRSDHRPVTANFTFSDTPAGPHHLLRRFGGDIAPRPVVKSRWLEFLKERRQAIPAANRTGAPPALFTRKEIPLANLTARKLSDERVKAAPSRDDRIDQLEAKLSEILSEIKALKQP